VMCPKPARSNATLSCFSCHSIVTGNEASGQRATPNDDKPAEAFLEVDATIDKRSAMTIRMTPKPGRLQVRVLPREPKVRAQPGIHPGLDVGCQ
jgi:hypothetical protein